MNWEILVLPEVQSWLDGLSEKNLEEVTAVIDALHLVGPDLKRPIVGKVVNSKYSNMKELIPLGSNIRILFIFDPKRRAVLLLGGDKSSDFRGWYRKFIPIADKRYMQFLQKEGLK